MPGARQRAEAANAARAQTLNPARRAIGRREAKAAERPPGI
ncbi:hypothetical protein [Falsiroseomonas oryzae]|nr:hypothetical protein [Roseomonas sp. MO-31]